MGRIADLERPTIGGALYIPHKGPAAEPPGMMDGSDPPTGSHFLLTVLLRLKALHFQDHLQFASVSSA